LNKRRFAAALLMLVFTFVGVTSTQAGDVVLNNNAGADSRIWQIQGEPSLVINGFDLGPLGVNLPVSVDRVSIDVETPVPGQPATVVVYQDANGGSPQDATLIGQAQVTIQQAGVYTYTFPTPVEVTQPVVWVGFYLPVGFEFRADTSGSSVLTYWGWEPGSTFDLSNLAAPSVFGPSDGTAPVNLNLGGIARITAEIITDGTVTPPTTTGGTPLSGDVRVEQNREFPPRDDEGRIIQAVGPAEQGFGPMTQYENCTALAYDGLDIGATYNNSIRIFCKLNASSFSPKEPEGYNRRGPLQDVYVFGVRSAGTEGLPYAITHCMVAPGGTEDRAVLGLAYGAPRQWEILPTVRYGENILCAEVAYTGYVSAFVPE
jgi:hypothetical protein